MCAAERLRAQLAEGATRSHRTLPPEASHTHLTPDTDPSFSTFSLRRSARRPRVERGAFDETSLPSLGEESRRGGNAHTPLNAAPQSGGGGGSGGGSRAQDRVVSGGGMVAVGTRRPPTGRVASIV